MSTVQEIPLNQLVPSSRNVRRTGAAEGVPELAASIAVHGLLQNLTVVAARKSGRFEVIAGGRRLAALKLLAKEGDLAKDAPVPCHVLEGGIAEEISLAENTMQCPMHPADQFEAFEKLHREHGMSAEDIAARFGVTAAVVKQRLKLGAISPKLMQAYRDGEINLDQLTAFAITDDHARQERVWDSLPSYHRSRDAILRALNEESVPSDDRRVLFVGLEAYEAAGGTVLRDLFDEEGGGFLADPELLDRLAAEKLETLAAELRQKGWKWVEHSLVFDRALTAGMRRVYPEPVELSAEQEEALEALEARYNELCDIDDSSDETLAEAERIEAEIDAIRGGEQFRPEDVLRAGCFVTLDHHGEPRIEEGLVRPEDDMPEEPEPGKPESAPRSGPAPLSEKLVSELTAHRTAALRNELAASPGVALIAVTHALAAATFYHASEASCLELDLRNASLTPHAPGIGEGFAETQIAERHAAWERRMPEEPDALWGFVAALDPEERLALLAHCASLSVNAVKVKGQRDRSNAADSLAAALSLDMTRYWQPTAASYLGRVSKERIVEAVAEATPPEQAKAKALEGLKKAVMAETSERMLVGAGWLPGPLRTPAA